MCGLVGIFGLKNIEHHRLSQTLEDMSYAIRYRGPDDSGVWFNLDDEIGLGHRRLSVVDLSSSGAQPMESRDRRFVIAYNGEIYNHLELRKDLLGHESFGWRGHSDTETLVELIASIGVQKAIAKCVGMFLFALWDRLEKKITLGIDRFGEKPLYYGFQNGSLVFASELNALRKFPGFDGLINRQSLDQLVKKNCIGAPNSIYLNIYKLKPGHLIELSRDDLSKKLIKKFQYWNALDLMTQPRRSESEIGLEEAKDHLESLIKRSIGEQLIADVPVGVFLSGGIDSSLVAAIMQSKVIEPIKTFSIGFSDKRYDEAPYAHKIAKFIGSDHNELYLSEKNIVDTAIEVHQYYDEPFADSSQIPMIHLAKLAKSKVTVCLSGDGGDELFGGYNRYIAIEKWWTLLSLMNPILKKLIAEILTYSVNENILKRVEGIVKLVGVMPIGSIEEKLYKLASALNARSELDVYEQFTTHWSGKGCVLLESESAQNSDVLMSGVEQPWEKMMILDTFGYLPNDILTKVDRAAMSQSLETRIPLLDHRVFEYAWSLPANYLIKNGSGKLILKELLKKYIPLELFNRPKKGFGVPLGEWLRGPLRDWAEDQISLERLTNEGYFDPKPIRKKWAELMNGRGGWQYHLWDVIAFQAWNQRK
jgi:asparagine synthase (glutamine-hydrolysing)